jgi:2,4-dienoyl-CoA reductase-like NADH-dependent reductase (Old Yellow Enzyme family)/thioredoxin reductase
MSSSTHAVFPHLFQPFQLKNVTLRNRVAISGHFAGWYVGPGGLPSDELAAYIEERAKGGIGLFVIGSNVPVPRYDWIENTGDAIIPRYHVMAEAGHRHGAKVFAQLCHPGFFPLPGPPRVQPAPRARSTQPVSRGPVRYTPSTDELRAIIAAHGAAAERVAAGGLDGVELHAHEFFLHAQMLSPVWNERVDEYGGSFDNRLRFLIETLAAMREAVGTGFVVGVRLKAADMLEGGMGVEDYLQALRRLEELRLIDYVNLSGGDAHFHHGPMPRPEGEWLDLIKPHRAATSAAIMHAGRLSTPELAERALAAGVIDIAVMTKSHIADAQFTRKVFEGRLDDIRFCTRCLQSCHGNISKMTCVYNPVTSREKEWADLKPSSVRRRVLVVGAGPAGMEAALTAALRGHEVTVFEQADRVGGQIWTGAGSPLRRAWARIAEFYQRQARKGLFEVRLGTQATVDNVLAHAPDAVVIATGSTPNRLELPDGPAALTVHEVIVGAADMARRVVLFDREGFSRPLVAADYLSARGIEVDFVTSLLQVCPAVEGHMLDEMIQQLRARGVRFWSGLNLVRWVREDCLLARDVQTAEEQLFDDVTKVVATIGSTSNTGLADALRAHGLELYVIGDANIPQTVEQATYQGGLIGRKL